MYKVLTRASAIIEVVEDVEKYDAVVVSTNGTILQPYDTSTTLIGSVLKSGTDITSTIKNVKWTKWNPTEDNLVECPEWNSKHIGSSTITISKTDVDSKSVFVFEAYTDDDILLCSSSISIVDINDLLVSIVKPENPYVGQVWVDSSTDPATLYVWNGYKWVVSGAVGALVKNLLRNTGFLFNIEYWDIVGDTTLSYTPYSYEYLGHRFLKLNSEILSDENRGLSQTIQDGIKCNGEYSFQMLFYSKNTTETFSNNIRLNIYSINNKDVETIVYNNVLEAGTKIKQVYARFNALPDSEKIRVEILGENGYRYDFSISELALYNTWNEYDWTVNPNDLSMDNMDLAQEGLWNILSNYGAVQGIFSERDPVTGQLEYFINASYIGAGKVKAQYMEMYGLKVFRKDAEGNPTEDVTLEVTENGEINLNVSKLVLVSTGQTVEEVVEGIQDEINEVKQMITPEGIQSTVVKIVTENEEITQHVTSIATQTAEGFAQTVENKLTGQISEVKQTTDGILEKVNDPVTGLSAQYELNKKGIYLSATGDGAQSLVNIENKEVFIKSNSIKLEGYTTINGGFKVDLQGNMEAVNGKFNGTIEGSIVKGSTVISPTIKSDETPDPKFLLTADGTLKATNATIVGQISGSILTGKTFKSESGKFIVTDTGVLECQDATIKGSITAGSTITGATVTGTKIIGSTIQNSATNPTFIVSSDGTVTGAKIQGGSIGIGGAAYNAFTVDNAGNCNITKGSITIGSNFRVTNTGVLTAKEGNFTGSINSGSTITGSTIIGTSIQNALYYPTFKIDADGNITGGSITIGNNFKVTNEGNLTAKNASFTGNVNSGSTITGSTIIGTTIQNAAVYPTFKIDSSGHISGGSINIGNNFIVTNDGALTAKSASFTGSINSGSTINGSTISGTTITGSTIEGTTINGTTINGSTIVGTTIQNALYYPTFKIDSNGHISGGSIDIGNGNFSVTSGGVLTARYGNFSGAISSSTITGSSININNVFKVESNGALTATNATISGTVSGSKIIGSTIQNSAYSPTFSIDANGNIFGGSININYNFQVSSEGVMKATGANISGTITATKGKIAGYTISNNMLVGNKVGMSGSTGEGYAFWAGNSQPSYAPFRVAHDGSLAATNAEITGTIIGSTIKSAAVNESNMPLFSMSPTGEIIGATVDCKSLTADGSISSETLNIDVINNSRYPQALDESLYVYITPGATSATDWYDGAVYANMDDLYDAVPRNLNGYTIKIYLTADYSGNINLNRFHSGHCYLMLQRHTVKGYIYANGPSMRYAIYGNTNSSTGGTANLGNIKPGVGKTNSDYKYSLYFEYTRITLYDVNIYAASQSGVSNSGIVVTNMTSAYMNNINAYNNPIHLVRSHASSHVYISSSSGLTKGNTFSAVSGSIQHLNKTKQAGCGTSGTNPYHTSGNAQIFRDGVTFATSGNSGTNDTKPPAETVETHTVTLKATSGNTFRRTVYRNWKNDGTVRQGDWGYGDCDGYWFFGSQLNNYRSKNITKVQITIKRNSGGIHGDVSHKIVGHNYTSKPSGTPEAMGSTIATVSMSVGETKTITLSSSQIATFKNYKGIGLKNSYSSGYYSVCSATCTVKITYKE